MNCFRVILKLVVVCAGVFSGLATTWWDVTWVKIIATVVAPLSILEVVMPMIAFWVLKSLQTTVNASMLYTKDSYDALTTDALRSVGDAVEDSRVVKKSVLTRIQERDLLATEPLSVLEYIIYGFRLLYHVQKPRTNITMAFARMRLRRLQDHDHCITNAVFGRSGNGSCALSLGQLRLNRWSWIYFDMNTQKPYVFLFNVWFRVENEEHFPNSVMLYRDEPGNNVLAHKVLLREGLLLGRGALPV